MLASKFQIWNFEETLDEAIKTKYGDLKGWITTNRMVVIKSNKPRATRKQQSIDDFSELEWEKVLLALTDEDATDYIIKIEVSADAEKPTTRKRPAEVLSDGLNADGPESGPRQRVTRTDQLLDRARIRTDTFAEAGNFDRALLNRWQCNDENCRNQNSFCFVDFAGKHFNMNHTQQSLWGKAIVKGDANVSIERLPTSLYTFWSDKQGAVTSLSRRSDLHQERLNARAEQVEKEGFMTKYQRFAEQNMEMRMTEQMADQMERMNSRGSSEPNPPPQQPPLQQWSSWRQSSIYSPYQTLPYQPWQQPPQPPQPPPWQQPPQPIQWQQPSSSHPPSLPPQPAIVAQRSSPVGLLEEEEEIIDQFFNWKTNKAPRQAVKIAEVRRLVEAQMWSIDNLKEMADSTSTIYLIALQLGVPDGMARAFKEDLKVFKAH